MLTSRTKRRLVVFVALSLLGVAYVGARYARLDSLVVGTSYDVTAQFREAGGIFTGAEVSYRGVRVGTVSDLRLTRDGVDVILSIDKSARSIPADTLAEVANKSAVGEQYVDLQPRTDEKPYLEEGSVIAWRDTAVPVSPTEVLTGLDDFVTSVPQGALRTTVSELGTAFQGTGDDLARMVDTSDAFLQTAVDNLDVTTALIRHSSTVLRTQAAKGSAIRSFARDLALFSDTFAHNDHALRALIDSGSAAVGALRTFLEANGVDLGELINNLVTTGEVVVKRLPGVRQVLVLYPYAVASGYTIVAKGPGGYQTRSGLVLGPVPGPCRSGYDPGQWRTPLDRSDRPMDADARCTDPPTRSNPRGAQNAPRAAPSLDDGPPIATYEIGTGRFTWADAGPWDQDSVALAHSSADVFAQLLLRPLG